MTSALVPRLAWGVGHRRIPDGACRVGICLKDTLKWKNCLLCRLDNSHKLFYQDWIYNLMAKLEKNQLDIISGSPPQAGYCGGGGG